jgi:predicted MFS family arabinose efflux permease
MILAPAGNILSAAAPNYGGVIAGRVLYGIGSSIPLGIGAATVGMLDVDFCTKD